MTPPFCPCWSAIFNPPSGVSLRPLTRDQSQLFTLVAVGLGSAVLIFTTSFDMFFKNDQAKKSFKAMPKKEQKERLNNRAYVKKTAWET